MRENPKEANLAAINNALIYYETAGEGQPFVMIHAGVADHRQWNNEFAFFAKNYHVIRYDMRGHGKSEPVEGEFSHLQDLISLLDFLQIEQPMILMGCSMGGGLAMDFALEQPDRVKALIMVGSAPSGVGSVLQSVVEKLAVPNHPKWQKLSRQTRMATSTGWQNLRYRSFSMACTAPPSKLTRLCASWHMK
jgi:3-oxoadipate enol-lactonase